MPINLSFILFWGAGSFFLLHPTTSMPTNLNINTCKVCCFTSHYVDQLLASVYQFIFCLLATFDVGDLEVFIIFKF